ncbi:MAG: spermidine synthase [Shewanella sp.]|uniref:polyamine aminopropyltransferase n=1 Tax=Shewanella TaxID=22 RepID=UPI00167B02CE|nr:MULTISPECIES: polyamine aminopropyltransferase [Shewanella]MBO1270127.1 polyamine aminopropyltransferase [Shewanella sp. 4t3-1-2LB]MCL2905264.1 polyamine aminopropyltransferase [Shewanella fodinae]MDN5370838.1 spermidine synthase [Shewanella sp.]GGY87391.1 polyamine aminopropyltransferase [Shewanella fodinae]
MQGKPQYLETLHSAYGQYFEVDAMLYEQKTPQWHLSIFENRQMGRVMALNGVIQTTERDEFVYHEMLTHVPILAHGHARKVLIIGGGDGGMLREVVKHRQLTDITMVEIDGAVVEMCREYLPHHSAGAFDDPRVRLVIADGLAFVRECQQQFDVIISDCTDPCGPGEVLFSSEFYQNCKRCLTANGIFVAQNGVPFMQLDEVQNTVRRISSYVQDCWFYQAAVPTYVGGCMVFAWATDDQNARQLPLAVLQERFQRAAISTRYYTPAVHQASFALPAYVEQAVASAMTVTR